MRVEIKGHESETLILPDAVESYPLISAVTLSLDYLLLTQRLSRYPMGLSLPIG